MQPLLIIDGERSRAQTLKRQCSDRGWRVVVSQTLADARHLVVEDGLRAAAVLSASSLPDGDALDLLEGMRDKGAKEPWILLGEIRNEQARARAQRLGIRRFMAPPFDDAAVEGALKACGIWAGGDKPASGSPRAGSAGRFVGRSEAARRVRATLDQLARVPASSVLLTGETGTGKGLAARSLHQRGLRARGPFVEANCAALPHDLLESELFGHEPGAFTGAKARHHGFLEQADGGILFLDEIGEMDVGLQSKLLKAIEEQSFYRLGSERPTRVDFQLIAASNRNLAEAARSGEFRTDLYHRISVFEVTLPPLRARQEDIKELVFDIVAEFNRRAGKSVTRVPEEAWERMRAYDWPGNVRELRNVIERSVLMSEGAELPLEWLRIPSSPFAGTGVSRASDDHIELPLDGTMALDEMERVIIAAALGRFENNVMATARALGTTRETLRYRINKHGLAVNHRH